VDTFVFLFSWSSIIGLGWPGSSLLWRDYLALGVRTRPLWGVSGNDETAFTRGDKRPGGRKGMPWIAGLTMIRPFFFFLRMLDEVKEKKEMDRQAVLSA
jgi:hypothetical protein